LEIVTTSCSGWHTKSEVLEKGHDNIAYENQHSTNGMVWPAIPMNQEIVMTAGMEITARTGQGDIKIRAGRDFERYYTWDDGTRSAKLWPRKQRWYGSLGIYYPGPGEHWKSNNGITRGVLQEGILWFNTVENALSWIEWARSTGIDYVYTDSGLIIGFGKVLARKQINVNVWQIMVDGEKPLALPRSNNHLVIVSGTL
jgi:hypothetical protein